MIRKLARPMIASVYIADGVSTIKDAQSKEEETQNTLDTVKEYLPSQYSKFIPSDPATAARGLGAAKVAAGSLLAIGKAPRLSAATLALLSAPEVLTKNAFWKAESADEKAAQRQGLLTDAALLGGLVIVSMDTEGKPGLKWRANRAAKKASNSVQQALPTKEETESFADSAKSWLGDASDKVAEVASQAKDYVEENKDDWIEVAQETAEKAKDTAVSAAEKAKDFFDDNADEWLETAQAHTKAAQSKAVKAASAAQSKAQEAWKQVEKSQGKNAKKAEKKAKKLQKDAEKAAAKAKKKTKKFDI
ncbi:MAG: DoxX family protein [Corynebacterium sp.]|nr:DoxX family protein [Corynebacterium sp.]